MVRQGQKVDGIGPFLFNTDSSPSAFLIELKVPVFGGPLSGIWVDSASLCILTRMRAGRWGA